MARQYRIGRFVSVAWAVVETMLFGGLVNGWASLVFVLKEDGLYADLCNQGRSGVQPVNASLPNGNAESSGDVSQNGTSYTLQSAQCTAQDAMLNLWFTVAAALRNMFGIVVGLHVFKYGTRAARLAGWFCFIVGALMMAFANDSNPWLVLPALLSLSYGGVALLLTNVQISCLFPRAAGVVITLVSGAFDFSATTQLLVKVLYEFGLLSRMWSYVGLACLQAVIVLLSTLLFMPRDMFITPQPDLHINDASSSASSKSKTSPFSSAAQERSATEIEPAVRSSRASARRRRNSLYDMSEIVIHRSHTGMGCLGNKDEESIKSNVSSDDRKDATDVDSGTIMMESHNSGRQSHAKPEASNHSSKVVHVVSLRNLSHRPCEPPKNMRDKDDLTNPRSSWSLPGSLGKENELPATYQSLATRLISTSFGQLQGSVNILNQTPIVNVLKPYSQGFGDHQYLHESGRSAFSGFKNGGFHGSDLFLNTNTHETRNAPNVHGAPVLVHTQQSDAEFHISRISVAGKFISIISIHKPGVSYRHTSSTKLASFLMEDDTTWKVSSTSPGLASMSINPQSADRHETGTGRKKPGQRQKVEEAMRHWSGPGNLASVGHGDNGKRRWEQRLSRRNSRKESDAGPQAVGLKTGGETSGVESLFPTLKSCLTSAVFWLHVLWVSFNVFRLVAIFGLINAKLTTLFLGDKDKVSFYTNVQAYFMLSIMAVCWIAGAIYDWQTSVYKERSQEFQRRVVPGALPLMMTSLVGVAISVLWMIDSEIVLYVLFACLVFYNAFIFGISISFLLRVFPERYFGILNGVLSVVSGCFCFLQYGVFRWHEIYPLQAEIFMLILVVISLLHPIYIIVKGLKQREVISTIETRF